MNIQFNFQGTEHKADVLKFTDDQIEVQMKDELENQFGSRFHYSVEAEDINFTPLKPSHSMLYQLQSEIKNALLQQKHLSKV